MVDVRILLSKIHKDSAGSKADPIPFRGLAGLPLPRLSFFQSLHELSTPAMLSRRPGPWSGTCRQGCSRSAYSESHETLGPIDNDLDFTLIPNLHTPGHSTWRGHTTRDLWVEGGHRATLTLWDRHNRKQDENQTALVTRHVLYLRKLSSSRAPS